MTNNSESFRPIGLLVTSGPLHRRQSFGAEPENTEGTATPFIPGDVTEPSVPSGWVRGAQRRRPGSPSSRPRAHLSLNAWTGAWKRAPAAAQNSDLIICSARPAPQSVTWPSTTSWINKNCAQETAEVCGTARRRTPIHRNPEICNFIGQTNKIKQTKKVKVTCSS